MTLAEMHSAFRFKADTINSQRTRAILPIHIDFLLNQAVLQELNDICRVSFVDDSLDLNLETIASLGSLIIDLPDQLLISSDYRGIDCKRYSITSTGVHQIVSSYTTTTNNVTGKVRFTNGNYLTHVLEDYLSKSKPNSTVGCIHDNNIYVFEDDFTLNKIHIQYIKTPIKLQLNVSGDCELHPRLHDKIVSNAVDSYMAIINRPDKYQMLVNETNKL